MMDSVVLAVRCVWWWVDLELGGGRADVQMQVKDAAIRRPRLFVLNYSTVQ